MDFNSFQCPCCANASINFILVCTLFAAFSVAHILMNHSGGSGFTKHLKRGFLSFVLTILGLLLVLASSSTARSYIFSLVLPNMPVPSSGPLFDLRCNVLSTLKGRVLEIGPGTGNNFACWKSGKHQIKEWVGIEPNTFFQEHIYKKKEENDINFPVRFSWTDAASGNLNITVGEEKPFDYVIVTHVLCSIDDLAGVFKVIHENLNKGGKFVFMEHVATDKKGSLTHLLQLISEPVFTLVGNGCKFKNMAAEIKTGLESYGQYNFEFEHLDAPMPFPMMKPHLSGYAKKIR